MKAENRNCQSCNVSFVIDSEDFDFYQKLEVPPPTWCPKCRFKRRMVWRNEKVFYKRRCDVTGKDMLSLFPPDAKLKVFERDYWWSDKWDDTQYGKEYDFSRPFFEQLKELFEETPLPSRSFLNMLNSEYCMNASNMKNCYLCFDSNYDEDCSYSTGLFDSKGCLDMLSATACELSYESYLSGKCYQIFFSSECENSQNIWFSKDLIGCSYCFGCIGLRNKKYHIFNQEYSREEYERKLAEFRLDSHANLLEMKKKVEAFYLSFPRKYMHGMQNKNVSGDYIYNSKNVHKSYKVLESEDCKYCIDVAVSPGAKDSFDYDLFGWNAERCYECNVVGYNVANIKFSILTYLDCRDVEYAISCISVKNIFGCVGLKKKQYCILNKQYTKEEYEALLPKIKQHMDNMPYVDKFGRSYGYGEFVPLEFSPFPYNVSLTQEYVPLTKEEAEGEGFIWEEPKLKNYEITISWKDLPDSIEDVDDTKILEETILCQAWDEDRAKAQAHNCTKGFRLTPGELVFYKQNRLPLPRKCFYSRHSDRTKHRNPVFSSWDRQCMCDNKAYRNSSHHLHHGNDRCQKTFQTSFSPERPEIVYCETCYQQEVA